MRFKNHDRLKRKLRAMPKEAKKEISKAIKKSAEELVALQKRTAPVDDGDLRDSIEWAWGGTGAADVLGHERLAAEITAGGTMTTKGGYDYALGVEFGTQKTPAQPFFYPGYRLIKKRIKGRVKRATNKAARKVAGQ